MQLGGLTLVSLGLCQSELLCFPQLPDTFCKVSSVFMPTVFVAKLCLKEEWNFLYCFFTSTKFRKPCQNHVIKHGVFAPLLGIVAQMTVT